MHDHIGNLYEKIRNKALKEYFMPYGAVDLKKMADAFQTSVPLLEKEISKLILSGWINARIDSYNQVRFFSNLCFTIFHVYFEFSK